MATSTSSIVFLQVILVVMDSATLAFTASVKIDNQIASEPPIQVHCRNKWKKDVVPETTLRNGEHVEWGFKPNIWGTTEYHCDFKWGAETQNFVVWWDAFFLYLWWWRPCTNCVWHVNQDGFAEVEAGVSEAAVTRYPWK